MMWHGPEGIGYVPLNMQAICHALSLGGNISISPCTCVLYLLI